MLIRSFDLIWKQCSLGPEFPSDHVSTELAELNKVGRHYFDPSSRKLHASKQAISHLLGIPASHLEGHLSLITATLCT